MPTFKQPQPPEEPPAEQKDAAGDDGNLDYKVDAAADVEDKPLPPDADLPDPPPLRAIVRIRIPLVKEEQPAEGDDEA